MEETDEIPDSRCVSCNVGEPACFEPGTFMRETESAAQDEAETRNPTPGPVTSGGVPLPYGLVPIVSPCPCGACGERRDRSLGHSDWWPYGKFGSNVITAEGLSVRIVHSDELGTLRPIRIDQ